jgi:hypothetical protein
MVRAKEFPISGYRTLFNRNRKKEKEKPSPGKG